MDPDAGAVQAFAAGLRALREAAGTPSYRRLAQAAHYSPTALSSAAAGHDLPSLDVTVAFVQACGGDPAAWTERWHEASGALPAPAGESAVPPPTRAACGRRRTWRWTRGWTQAAVAAAVACTAGVTWWLANSGTAPDPGKPGVGSLRVEGTGLYVSDAVVTNAGTRAGYGYIVNTGTGQVHESPTPLQPGQSWTYHFNRDLKSGAQVCGSINLGPDVCSRIHPDPVPLGQSVPLPAGSTLR